MDKQAKVVQLLKNLAKPRGDIFFYATVTKITGDTCSVKITDLELTDVRLKATDNGADDKLLLTPKVNSLVIVGSNHGDLTDLMVIRVDDPEKILYKHQDITIDIDGSTGKIIINEGDNFGLVKVKENTEKLNNLEKDINTLKTAFASWVPVPQDGGAALKAGTTKWAAQQLIETRQSDIEDKDVTH